MSPTASDAALVRIVPAEGMDEVRALFEEYRASLGLSPCFEGFARELAELPGDYAPPAGCILVARVGTEPAGVVALRPLADGAAEMKRLYVRPAHRGRGIGLRLAADVIAEARARGHRALRLETLDSMAAARQLYAELGFVADTARKGGVLRYELPL